MQSKVNRIIDANLNRAREGLRVVEETLRFVLDDEIFYEQIKSIRHKTDKILCLKYAQIIVDRDSSHDVGKTQKETSQKTLEQILISNFKRAQEALRVLEEYSKTFDDDKASISGAFKQRRYELYELEKNVVAKYKDIF